VFLVGIAQYVRGMERGQVYDAILLEWPPTASCDAGSTGYGQERRIAEEQHELGLDHRNLIIEPLLARFDFALGRRLVVRRSATDGVAYKRLVSIDAGILEQLVQELTGFADEGHAIAFLLA